MIRQIPEGFIDADEGFNLLVHGLFNGGRIRQLVLGADDGKLNDLKQRNADGFCAVLHHHADAALAGRNFAV